MKHIYLDETESTHSYATDHCDELEMPVAIIAHSQTSGRGQRGNSWESEPGKNLTFSILFKPEDFLARRQFFISEAFSLALVDTLSEWGIQAQVKWPNDIYVGNRKICGILIEHGVTGQYITRTVAGAGLNINQTEFLSDAPNPVSMAQVLGYNVDIENVQTRLFKNIEKRLESINTPEGCTQVHDDYLARLWRGDGRAYSFRDVASGEVFKGTIVDVEPMGFLILTDNEHSERRYAFKEVEFLL